MLATAVAIDAEKRIPRRFASRNDKEKSGLDFFFGEFQFQAERVGEAVGQVDEAGEQVDVDDFGIGEFFSQGGDVGVGDVVGRAGKFVGIGERGFFFGGVAGVVPGAERGPVFGGEAYAF